MNKKIEFCEIPVEKYSCETYTRWAKQSMILTAGNFATNHYNLMTVGWGAFGAIWDKPFAMVVVRPQRHTAVFMDEYDTFTLCGFPEGFRGSLNFCGTKSGREFPAGEKAHAAGLTPIAAEKVPSPIFAEANFVMECKKIFSTVMKPENFMPGSDIPKHYHAGDYHKIYYGEIIRIANR